MLYLRNVLHLRMLVSLYRRCLERVKHPWETRWVECHTSLFRFFLTEAFQMRLLTIAGSFESPKRSNSTFKWLGKFLKDELMLDMSMKRDLRAFSKLRQSRKKCSLSSTSKLQLHKGFKVSRKPCLNLCSFKWLKRSRNLVK